MGIESRNFNTGVSSQGKKSLERGEKISIDKTRNISSIVDSEKRGTKISTIHDSFYDRKESSETHITDIERNSQNSANNTVKANSETIEPLAIFTFNDSEIENYSAAIYQAYFEDQISNQFSRQLISTLQEKQSDEFKNIASSIEKEIKDSENILNVIEEIDLQRDEFDNSLNDVNKDTVASFAKKNYESLNPDSLRYAEEFFGSLDPITILKKMTINHNTVDEKTNTSLATQLLQYSSYTLGLGITPAICKEKLGLLSGKDSVSSIIFQGKHS